MFGIHIIFLSESGRIYSKLTSHSHIMNYQSARKEITLTHIKFLAVILILVRMTNVLCRIRLVDK